MASVITRQAMKASGTSSRQGSKDFLCSLEAPETLRDAVPMNMPFRSLFLFGGGKYPEDEEDYIKQIWGHAEKHGASLAPSSCSTGTLYSDAPFSDEEPFTESSTASWGDRSEQRGRPEDIDIEDEDECFVGKPLWNYETPSFSQGEEDDECFVGKPLWSYTGPSLTPSSRDAPSREGMCDNQEDDEEEECFLGKPLWSYNGAPQPNAAVPTTMPSQADEDDEGFMGKAVWNYDGPSLEELLVDDVRDGFAQENPELEEHAAAHALVPVSAQEIREVDEDKKKEGEHERICA